MDEILAHEVGHALGLPHTHGYTNFGTTDELVNGSNCSTHGDRFCDTPADPNILGLVNGACVYVGNLTDANGQQYTPNTGNIMSYTNGNCRSHFSAEQHERMYDVASSAQFNCCLTPVPSQQNLNTCINTSILIDANSPVNTIRWYDHPTAGNLVNEGSTFQSPELSQSTAWYIEAFDGCASDRARILVEVLPGSGVLSNIPKQISMFESNGEQGGQNPGQGLGGYVQDIVHTDSMEYMIVSSKELWSFDGDSTRLITTFNIAGGTNVASIVDAEGMLLLGLNDWNANQILYKSDGTAAGTVEVKSWNANDYDYSNYLLTPLGNNYIFSLTRADGSAELWQTDGTTIGTALIKALPETSGYNDFGFYPFNGEVYFAASDVEGNSELWKTDGTEIGTFIFADINPSASSFPNIIADFGGMMYLVAIDGVNGSELWRTDGIVQPELVTDINPEGSSGIGEAFNLGDHILFMATDGITGIELWKSDGTPEGTVLVEDLNPASSSYPDEFCNCNSKVYFGASIAVGEHDALFSYDPATGETELIKRFGNNGYGGVEDLLCQNNQVFFRANNTGYNSEVWTSDGSNSGTTMIAEIHPSPSIGSYPSNFFGRNQRVFFTGSNGLTGNQLWTFGEEDLKFCKGDEVTINTGNTSGAVHWYEDSEANNLLHTGFSYTIPSIDASTSIYARFETGGCSSDIREFRVQVLSIDSLDFDAMICFETSTNLIVHTPIELNNIIYSINDGLNQANSTFIDLTEGDYLVRASYDLGCSVDSLISVNEAENVIANLNIIGDVLCYNDASGIVEVSAIGGAGTLQYTLDNGEPVISTLFSNLIAGEHTIQILDSLQCQYDALNFSLSSPLEIEATIGISPLVCGNDCGAEILLSATGGTILNSYVYSWYNSNDELLESQTSELANNLCADIYHVTIRDDNDCELILEEISIDPLVYTTLFADMDGDGFGDDAISIDTCESIPDYVNIAGDCDDSNEFIYPGAPGNGDGIDSNCDGFIDTEESACPGDLNGDGIVSAADLLLFLGGYGCSQSCNVDLDGDDDTDTSDLLLLLSFFGTDCN